MEWYAHRVVLPLLVFDVEIVRSASYTDRQIDIKLNASQFGQSPDIDFIPSERISQLFDKEQKEIKYTNFRSGRTKTPETYKSGKQLVNYFFMDIPDVLTVDANVLHRRWTFLTSIHAHKKRAFEAFLEGTRLLESGMLRRVHVERWLVMWSSGSIESEGNKTIARALAGSHYYIFSSLPSSNDPSWPFIGLSPCGLAWGDEESYLGHVFWDQETWMYPPLLLMHSELSWMLLETRFRTISGASSNANVSGYRGLRYPWESAFTGIETTNDEICATQEIHISGDISFAFRQFWWATGDEELMFSNESKFAEVVFGIADFWISRMDFNHTRQLFEIHRVQPPDEYADSVNNSAFTNMIASISLEFARDVAEVLKLYQKQKLYDYYAQRIYIPFNDSAGFHPEYDGFKLGTTVKQADVILMGFPFMWNMTAEVRLKDLEIYEAITSLKGPAMSDSMYAVGWLEQKRYDQAVKSFNKMFAHIKGDFQVWNENKGGDGATNFITGMGGFLQSILFGFGGIRLHKDHLIIDPVLPPDCNKLRFVGIDYRGSSLSIDVDRTNTTLTLTSQGRVKLRVRVGRRTEVLRLNRPVIVASGKATIEVVTERHYAAVKTAKKSTAVRLRRSV